MEDEKIIAVDIQKALEYYGYEVVATISQGQEAIDFVNKTPPDLILMDIMLEGTISGLEVAEYINKNCDIPVIFLTAYANDEILEKASHSSPYGYLIKPFNDRELRVAIEMAFYKYRMEHALKASRKFLLKVIDNVPNSIFVKNAEQKYLMANKTLADLYETSPKLMIGKTEQDFIEFVHQQDGNPELSSTDEGTVLAEQQPIQIPEEYLVLPNQEVRWFQTTKVPMYTPQGESVVLGVSVDITDRKKTTEELKQSNVKLKKLLEETVNGLVSAMEMRDPYTAGHQRRVSLLASRIAKEMQLSQDQIDGIRIASTVHDIGKIYVPSEILSKPGRLTDAEMNLIKTHPRAGYDILCRIQFPWPVADIVIQHQERIDGAGYPEGLKDDEIMLEAKILSVADVVEAIASHRPYRPALGVESALDEIEKNSGIKYDAVVAKVCLELFQTSEFAFEEIPLTKRR